MNRGYRLVPALLVAALLAACAGDSTTPLAPSDAPALNGQAGNERGAGTAGSFGSTTTSTTSGDDPVPADSSGRGGHIVGGN